MPRPVAGLPCGLTLRLDDQREAEEYEEHDIELVEAAEDAAEALSYSYSDSDFST